MLCFVFWAGVAGAGLGIRACAQASKRKYHISSWGSAKRANGVSLATIIVSIGLLDPAGAYTFGRRAPSSVPNRREKVLHGGAKHIVAISLTKPPSVFATLLSEPTGAMFRFTTRSNMALRKKRRLFGNGKQIANIAQAPPSVVQLVLRSPLGPGIFGAGSPKFSSM